MHQWPSRTPSLGLAFLTTPHHTVLQVMLHKSETSRSRVPHVSMRDIKVRTAAKQYCSIVDGGRQQRMRQAARDAL